MTDAHLASRFAELCAEPVHLPGLGDTPSRHQRLFEIGREDLSLAKLVEAHWDAVAILDEAGRRPVPGARYAVWASELPGQPLLFETTGDAARLHGTKHFCSGAALVDRALVTAGTYLLDVDLRGNEAAITTDGSAWSTEAFRQTQTSTLQFNQLALSTADIVGTDNWYTTRPGFWLGACGPAACWAGGAAGLLDLALASRRDDPHTVAHFAAMHANVWAMQSLLQAAGEEIDARPKDVAAAHTRALQLRHLIEQLCTDTLRRFARAYGPQPLSMNADAARRYHELDLYLRQSHAERDLEALGRAIREHERR